eukprot:SAG11_NODE_12744_length_687_cov_1.168367_1_plen_29_part_01
MVLIRAAREAPFAVLFALVALVFAVLFAL